MAQNNVLKLTTIVGARPQFIKAAAVSRAIAKYNESRNSFCKIKEVIVHTGQHYDATMSRIFFEQLRIPEPNYNLGVGSDSHGKQTAKMLSLIEDVLRREKPDLVMTYGDTNSTLAGALAAVKLHIPSAHVEAGLRSYNRLMPEEINRVLTDQISNLLFCPTENAVANLRKEGIASESLNNSARLDFQSQYSANVGDVMYDSILFYEKLAYQRSNILRQMGLLNLGGRVDRFCLVTVHRAENTDSKEVLAEIIGAVKKIVRLGIKVVFPVHPRTRKKMNDYGLGNKFLQEAVTFESGLIISKPLGYFDLLLLEKNATAVVTDSGGIQKEAFLMRVPCITLRYETEWVETVHSGWNLLVGPNRDNILHAIEMINAWKGASPPFCQHVSCDNNREGLHNENPYGDGHAADRIVGILGTIANGQLE